MRCLYCDKLIDTYSFKSFLFGEDKLCINCRDRLLVNKQYIQIDGIKIETFYDYDSFFKDLIIQYKECYDEALKDVFLYELKEYIRLKYFGYKIILIPSSKTKIAERGFNHLELIFSNVGLPIIEGLSMIDDNLIQENKSNKDRQLMRNNYLYKGPKLNKVLIVDDVLTTGSSMLGAYSAIRPYANRVKCLSLACVRKRFHF